MTRDSVSGADSPRMPTREIMSDRTPVRRNRPSTLAQLLLLSWQSRRLRRRRLSADVAYSVESPHSIGVCAVVRVPLECVRTRTSNPAGRFKLAFKAHAGLRVAEGQRHLIVLRT